MTKSLGDIGYRSADVAVLFTKVSYPEQARSRALGGLERPLVTGYLGVSPSTALEFQERRGDAREFDISDVVVVVNSLKRLNKSNCKASCRRLSASSPSGLFV